VERDFHDDIFRIGDTESDVKLRFPASALGIGRSSKTAAGVEDFVCLCLTRSDTDVGQSEVNGCLLDLFTTVTVNFT
jgi:hypothetical protein